MAKIKRDKMRPEDLQAGPRRLKDLVIAPFKYYPTEALALKEWENICRRKFDYNVERAESAFKIDVAEEEGGFRLRGVLHKACLHWMRTLQDVGIEVVIDDGSRNWEVQPARTLEELAQMVKGTGGRYWS